MATSFGNSKSQPNKRSAADIVRLYKENNSALDDQIAEIKTTALKNITMAWFEENPITLKNMVDWGKVLQLYTVRGALNFTTEEVEPIADYLNFISDLDYNDLIPSNVDKPSRRYDSFCEVLDTLSPYSIHDCHSALTIIALEDLVDLDGLMKKMDSMSTLQTYYHEEILNVSGEYKDIAAGQLMHALVGLSYNDIWDMPNDDPVYHHAWEVLNEDDDLEVFSREYDPAQDIIAHLVSTLPASTYYAFDYYQYNDGFLQKEQKEQILGMSLAHLDLPHELDGLLNILYYPDFDEDEFPNDALKIFTELNPAAKVLEPLVALFDSPGEILHHLENNPQLQEMILEADVKRRDAHISTDMSFHG